MSLDNIQLHPITVQDLFSKSLVELKTKAVKDEPVMPYNILGKNQRNIVLLVNYNEVVFLPDEALNFLLGILSACKLNMDDVGILNLAKYPQADYHSVSESLQPAVLLLLGPSPEEIQLPLGFPQYQVQRYNNQTYLWAPDLLYIEKDKAEKTKLWNALKQVFSL